MYVYVIMLNLGFHCFFLDTAAELICLTAKHLIKVRFACLMTVFCKFSKMFFKLDQSVLQQQSFRALQKILKLLLDTVIKGNFAAIVCSAHSEWLFTFGVKSFFFFFWMELPHKANKISHKKEIINN